MSASTHDKHCEPRPTRGDVSLKVLKHGPVRMGSSRSARWRTAVLIGVHVLIGIHIIQWLIAGMTISPVEPSEAMYTLELGQVNAGFVFFALAIISTFVFGRFFCGWGCHVVALQDLCTWLMNRMGVRPKPFRSRLLVFVPLGMGLYMFAWEPARRFVLLPILGHFGVQLPPWLSQTAPFPGFEADFLVEDFWATFPPWYLAIPFLLVCGFGVVYFLGSKGFCTYGCPYGGFFGPVDRVSVGRIVVSDACEGCGHCTAVCTSNVRVHQEVRDYGMVVDPGCMKCLDCVSVCPNQALSFAFARPAVLAKPRTEEARAGKVRRPDYDLTWPEEIGMAALFLAAFMSLRGMMNSVPLLMAAGLASMAVFLIWKLWQMVRVDNVRLQNLQLKLKGRWRPAGYAVAVAAVATIVLCAWSGHARFRLWWGEVLVDHVTVPTHVAFAPGYVPAEADRAAADRVIRQLKLGGPFADGGYGWKHTWPANERLAWLSAVAGRPLEAVEYLKKAVESGSQSDQVVPLLIRAMADNGMSPEDFRGWYRRVLAESPDSVVLRLEAAVFELMTGHPEEGIALAERVISGPPKASDRHVARACEVLLQAGRVDRAAQVLEARVQSKPKVGVYRGSLATARLIQNRPNDAIAELRRATELEPRNIRYWRLLAEVLGAVGQINEADEASRRADELEQGVATPP